MLHDFACALEGIFRELTNITKQIEMMMVFSIHFDKLILKQKSGSPCGSHRTEDIT